MFIVADCGEAVGHGRCPDCRAEIGGLEYALAAAGLQAELQATKTHRDTSRPCAGVRNTRCLDALAINLSLHDELPSEWEYIDGSNCLPFGPTASLHVEAACSSYMAGVGPGEITATYGSFRYQVNFAMMDGTNVDRERARAPRLVRL